MQIRGMLVSEDVSEVGEPLRYEPQSASYLQNKVCLSHLNQIVV